MAPGIPAAGPGRVLPGRVGKAEPPLKSALFLDLDKTIIPFASEQEFVGYLFSKGMVSMRRMGELVRFFVAHRLGLIRDYRQAKRTSARIVMAGKDLGVTLEHYDRFFEERVRPRIYPQVVRLVERHRAEGREIYVISASMDFIVERVARHLGADGWYAIEPEVRGGIFTGELCDPVLFSEEKERVVRELALTRRLDLGASHAYSDSHLDEPMLAAVGHPVAVNPDRKLAALAYRLSWPVVRWHLPRPDAAGA